MNFDAFKKKPEQVKGDKKVFQTLTDLQQNTSKGSQVVSYRLDSKTIDTIDLLAQELGKNKTTILKASIHAFMNMTEEQQIIAIHKVGK